MTTIFTNGCFDLLHVGHARLLHFARSLGDRLIVAINSDDSVRRLKGIDRPVDPLEIRREMLLYLGSVDEVIVFDDDTPYELIKSIRPDLIVKGPDYADVAVIGSDIAPVRILHCEKTNSTTNRLAACERLGINVRQARSDVHDLCFR